MLRLYIQTAPGYIANYKRFGKFAGNYSDPNFQTPDENIADEIIMLRPRTEADVKNIPFLQRSKESSAILEVVFTIEWNLDVERRLDHATKAKQIEILQEFEARHKWLLVSHGNVPDSVLEEHRRVRGAVERYIMWAGEVFRVLHIQYLSKADTARMTQVVRSRPGVPQALGCI